jgi:hypothetical protein
MKKIKLVIIMVLSAVIFSSCGALLVAWNESFDDYYYNYNNCRYRVYRYYDSYNYNHPVYYYNYGNQRCFVNFNRCYQYHPAPGGYVMPQPY